jgi:hypothetical protein
MPPPNKGMKLTRPERIGASQLIPGVRRTQRRWTCTEASQRQCEAQLPSSRS